MENLLFLHKRNYKQRQTTFSTAYRNDIKASQALYKEHPLMCKDTYYARRAAFAPSNGFQGSMTLEATLLLPIFLFAMMSLYSVIDMLCLQAKTTWYLQQIGNEISAYGHLIDSNERPEGLWEVIGDVTLSYIYVRERLLESIDFPDKVLVTTASLIEEGKTELVVTYNYPIVPGLGKPKELWLQSKYYGLSWGEAIASEEEKVYVTENGEVYHLYVDCSHLSLSITQLPRGWLQEAMKEYGKRLIPCSVCADRGDELVYITYEQGRYHYDKECGSLKRIVFERERLWAMARYELCRRCKERKEKYSG